MIVIQSPEQQFNGNLFLYLRKVLNPTQSGTATDILIKSYDGYDQTILESTYPNLDPFSFTYTFAGPIIKSNNGDTIEAYLGV